MLYLMFCHFTEKSGSFLRLNSGATSQILYTLRNVSFLIILDDSGSISWICKVGQADIGTQTLNTSGVYVQCTYVLLAARYFSMTSVFKWLNQMLVKVGVDVNFNSDVNSNNWFQATHLVTKLCPQPPVSTIVSPSGIPHVDSPLWASENVLPPRWKT